MNTGTRCLCPCAWRHLCPPSTVLENILCTFCKIEKKKKKKKKRKEEKKTLNLLKNYRLFKPRPQSILENGQFVDTFYFYFCLKFFAPILVTWINIFQIYSFKKSSLCVLHRAWYPQIFLRFPAFLSVFAQSKPCTWSCVPYMLLSTPFLLFFCCAVTILAGCWYRFAGTSSAN